MQLLLSVNHKTWTKSADFSALANDYKNTYTPFLVTTGKRAKKPGRAAEVQ